MRFIYTKTFTKIFVIFVFLALLAIADAQGYTGSAKDGFSKVFSFAVTKVSAVTNTIKVSFKTIFTIRSLVSENARLNREVDELTFENARLKSAQDENTALRRALNFTAQQQINVIAVEVLISDPTGFSQTFVIDKGSNQNIKLNQPIVAQPGLLVGKVTKLNPSTAVVTLITDPQIVINGEVVDSGAKGLIKGEHGLGLSLDLVTQNELIKTGDQVITSGLSDDFPRGLLIGKVASIRSTPADLFQKAFVSPAADLRNTRFLFAIIQ